VKVTDKKNLHDNLSFA